MVLRAYLFPEKILKSQLEMFARNWKSNSEFGKTYLYKSVFQCNSDGQAQAQEKAINLLPTISKDV